MSSYVRPLIEEPVFRDADGAVIEYGDRWHGFPPEDTYSVDTHPERFAPLHVVADALIEHLGQTYDVEIDKGAETVGDLLRPAFHNVLRAVRIRPSDPKCASLTLVFTAYPGIYMHAGLLHNFYYPVCGCDACDSNWEAEADELEQHVFATGNCEESFRCRKLDRDEALTAAVGGDSASSFASAVRAPRRAQGRSPAHLGCRAAESLHAAAHNRSGRHEDVGARLAPVRRHERPVRRARDATDAVGVEVAIDEERLRCWIWQGACQRLQNNTDAW